MDQQIPKPGDDLDPDFTRFAIFKMTILKTIISKSAMENSTLINYKSIFCDLLAKKHPEKLSEFQNFLSKNSLSELDVIMLSKKLSIYQKANLENGKHRSYCKNTILQILNYQKKHELNNSQLANHFRLSRNTVAKWKRLFQV